MKLTTRVDSLSTNWTNVHLAAKSGDSNPNANETVPKCKKCWRRNGLAKHCQ